MASIPDRRTDIGFQAVEEIARLWQIDADRIVWHADGFEWWPGHFRQVVWVSKGIEEDGRVNYKLSISSDFITAVDVTNSMLPVILHGLQQCTSSYAIKMIPEEVKQEWAVEHRVPGISLESTAYIRDDNIGWMPKFLAGMGVLQANDANIRAEHFAESLDGRPDTSAPAEGPLRQADELLLVVRDLYIPAGQEPSRWLDSGEFEEIAEKWGRLEHCYGNGDKSGLTLETAFGSDTALIQLFTNQAHPQLGNGLLANLKLPIWLDDSMSLDPNWYNFGELSAITYVPLLGSWTTYQMNDNQCVIAFSSFVPNLLYQQGLATNMILWMIGRANWARSAFYPDMIDEPLHEILQKRYAKI